MSVASLGRGATPGDTIQGMIIWKSREGANGVGRWLKRSSLFLGEKGDAISYRTQFQGRTQDRADGAKAPHPPKSHEKKYLLI